MSASPAIFANVPAKDYLHFYDDKGRFQPKKLVQFLDFSKADISKAATVSTHAVRFDDQMTSELEERLVQIANICELVAQYFKGDVEKTARWFRLENPLLGNLSPRDMIRFGKYKKLQGIIQNSLSGDVA